MAESNDTKTSSSMDHTGMDHSTMTSSQTKENTMQHNMKEHDGMPAQLQSKAADKVAADMSVLKMFPASGKAREAGFDGSYIMKQTTVESNIETQCVMASRGIIMLDRDSWKKCAVQPNRSIKQ
ncbi:MAG: hypothetical protein GXP19_01000 [Gammaproteobacteria bacterium]|nr:hypothetical protein [Gammaproteobacteria bacterium]